MTPSEKLAGLTNCETTYDSVVTYLDSYYHDDRYYLKSEADAKFFGPDNHGAGSGLVAETVDGLTAQQIMDAGFPSGGICAWAGSEAAIPSGFLLCNGLNSMPDLRGRALVAAGGHYNRGDTGGSNTVTTSGTVTIAGHTLTTSEIPKHAHTIVDYYNPLSAFGGPNYWTSGLCSSASRNIPTGYTGDDGSHTHSATFDGTDDQDKRPPHMALCLICKS
jgi:hypothetical protein